MTKLRHLDIETNGIRLHAVEAGPADGPLVILLHGFPEFWYCWRHQIAPLAKAGFRVAAPDQRGYNLSEKPRGIAAYRIDLLVADIAGLIGALGRESAHVVGHDWGAAVAWWLALWQPHLIERLVILNVPHPVVIWRHWRRNPRQLLRSWYVFFFQLPWLPEWGFRLGKFRFVERSLLSSSHPGTFSAEDLQRYRDAWAQPGALTSTINWYRAAARHGPQLPPVTRVSMPTLIIWGARDRFLVREMAPESLAFCEHGRLVLLEEATHWVNVDEPERVNELLLEFLGASPATTQRHGQH